jgi:hypothetical protein
MSKVVKGKKRGLQWRMMKQLEDLDFADDICLLAQRWNDIKAKLEKLGMEAAKVEREINEFKTKKMRVNPNTDLAMTANGREMEQVKSTYLGSIVTIRAVESVHKSSDSDSSIFKTSDSDSFIKAQYVLITVKL